MKQHLNPRHLYVALSLVFALAALVNPWLTAGSVLSLFYYGFLEWQDKLHREREVHTKLAEISAAMESLKKDVVSAQNKVNLMLPSNKRFE